MQNGGLASNVRGLELAGRRALMSARGLRQSRLTLLGAMLWGGILPAFCDPRWGANGHPLTSYPGITIEQQLDLLVDIGLPLYRVDVTSLDQIGRLHELVAAAKARGVTVLPVLLPGVNLKEQSEEAIYAQSRQFAKIMADEFKAEFEVWELGNELETFAIIQPCEVRDDGTQYPCTWGPAGGVGVLDYFGPRARKVLAVLQGLSDGIRSEAPQARRAIGTAGWGHLGFFDLLREHGVEWDISVWHIYGEDPAWAFRHLKTFGKPIWVTEFDFPSGSTKGGEAGQAKGLNDMITTLDRLAPIYNVEAAFVYELCDETYWAPSSEAFMGLVRLDKDENGFWRIGPPKAAYGAVKAAVAQAGH